MKWRKWPEEKPNKGQNTICRDNETYEAWFGINFDPKNPVDFTKDQNRLKHEIFEWLDESDSAFEEVAREGGWISEDEANKRVNDMHFTWNCRVRNDL